MADGKSHPLLVFRTRYRNHRGLYFLVAFTFFGLYLALNLLPASTWVRIPWGPDYDWLLLVIGSIIFLIALFRWIASEIPYVQCTERNIKIRTPLYPIVFSYKRMRETRPNTLFHVYGRAKLSRADRNLVLNDKIGGRTVLIVEMNSWPLSLRWMKFWMGNLMFTPDNRALVLWVEDWMALNRELSDFRDRWRERKWQERKGSLYSEVVKSK